MSDGTGAKPECDGTGAEPEFETRNSKLGQVVGAEPGFDLVNTAIFVLVVSFVSRAANTFNTLPFPAKNKPAMMQCDPLTKTGRSCNAYICAFSLALRV